MIALIGLGNPGSEYLRTRHNAGFLFIDYLTNFLEKSGKNIAFKNKFRSEFAITKLASQDTLMIKPLTYMNLSGTSVSEFVMFYKIPPENIFVFYDDVDLELGKIKVKQGGGSGGHNGIKSLDAHITQDYYRIRIGIGKGRGTTDKYVLSNFTEDELITIVRSYDKIIENLDILLKKDIPRFLNKLQLES